MEDFMEQGRRKPPAPAKRVDRDRLMEIRGIHQVYINGLMPLYERVKGNEEWFRLHSTKQERKEGTEIGKDGGFTSQGGWLVNVVVSKHADAMDACPESIIQPREPGDERAARTLNRVLPCILEQNGWRRTWSRAQWRKNKFGTGHYKVMWDKDKHFGLGDVSVQAVSVLNLAWRPTTTNIQDSPYFFHHEYVDRVELARQFPEIEELRKTPALEQIEEFLPDQEIRDKSRDATVVECWYKLSVPTGLNTTRKVLHRILYTGDIVLYASEDDPQCAERGWYDHGLYPYVFDPLFPVEDSACGLGYIDIGRNPQTNIDLLNTAMTKNAMVGAIPRYLSQEDNGINEEDLLDTSKPVIRVRGSIDERLLREIPHKSLEGNYITLRDGMIQELRETTGNTESSTGNSSSGVTAASAIAALQEASGKVSRDAIAVSYEAFAQVVEMVIGLIRQFYTAPRYFRITGEQGRTEFASLSGSDLGEGSVAFDISIKAQRMTGFDRVSHNELALQFYGLGFFDPARAEQAMMCLEMMDFAGKDALMLRISQQATMHQKLIKYMQLALTLAKQADPGMAEAIGQDIMTTLGQEAGTQMGALKPQLSTNETAGVSQARRRAQGASQPTT